MDRLVKALWEWKLATLNVKGAERHSPILKTKMTQKRSKLGG